MNRDLYTATFTYPSGYAASNIIPWPAVTQNHAAIRYYQRVLIGKVYEATAPTTPERDRLREDGAWGPVTQRWLAHWQAGANREMARGDDAFSKYGVASLRADGVLDEATQRVLQITGALNSIPRGSFAVGRPAATPSTTHSFVGDTASPLPATIQPPSSSYTAPTVNPYAPVVAQPTSTDIPWGTIAIVGGIVGIAAIAIAFAPKDRR